MEIKDKLFGSEERLFDSNGVQSETENDCWPLDDPDDDEQYEDEHGFYIQNDDEGLVPLNCFVHAIRPDSKYCFGGTVDYHFFSLRGITQGEESAKLFLHGIADREV